MAKLNYIVTSASNTFAGGACDTDMYFPFAGGKKKGGHIRTPIVQRTGGVKQKGREGRIIDLDDTWGYITEDEFEAMDDLEYLGFDGDNYVYADGKGRKFFSKIGKGIATGAKGVASAAKWVGKSLKNLVTKWGKKIEERRENRRKRKSRKQEMAFKLAMEKAKAKGIPQPQAEKIAQQEQEKVRQQEEGIINKAETEAYNVAKTAGKSIDDVEKAANDAGEQAEKQIYGGYLAGEDKGFWQSMGLGGKVAIIGGGALFIGLIVYLVVKKK